MGFKKVAELVIQGVEDRLTVSSILIKNEKYYPGRPVRSQRI